MTDADRRWDDWGERGARRRRHDASQDLAIKPSSLAQLRATIGSAAAPACWATRLAEQTPTPIAPEVDHAFFALASQAPGKEPLFANFILGRAHADW